MRFSLHVFADKRASARLLLFQKLQNSVEQRLQKMSSVFLPTLMTWTFPFTTKLCTIGNNSYEINGNFSSLDLITKSIIDIFGGCESGRRVQRDACL